MVNRNPVLTTKRWLCSVGLVTLAVALGVLGTQRSGPLERSLLADVVQLSDGVNACVSSCDRSVAAGRVGSDQIDQPVSEQPDTDQTPTGPGNVKTPQRLVVLTFDDSVKSHLTKVAPLLEKHGFGGTLFRDSSLDA